MGGGDADDEVVMLMISSDNNADAGASDCNDGVDCGDDSTLQRLRRTQLYRTTNLTSWNFAVSSALLVIWFAALIMTA